MMTWLQRLLLPQYLVGVVGVIENAQGELLLLRHTYRREFPWGFPSGFLENREQPDSALKREILEETGFDVELSSLLAVYTDPQRPLVSIIYRGRYLGGAFVSCAEVSDAEFFPLDRLPAIMPEQRRLLDWLARQEVRH
jgi:ADP-ribose pyrophosphatase YjhB (NUDIX family)